MGGDISEIRISTGFYQETKKAVADGVLDDTEKQKLGQLAWETDSPDDDALLEFLEDTRHVTAFQQASAKSEVPAYLDIPEADDATLRVGIQSPAEEAFEQGSAHLRASEEAEAQGDKTLEQSELEKAQQSYQRALELEPRNTGARHQLGLVLFRLGKLDEAIAHYRTALELSGADAHPTIHSNLGLAYARQGKWEEASEQFQAAAQKQPDNPNTRYLLGTTLQKLGRVDEALTQFKQVLELDQEGRYSKQLSSRIQTMAKELQQKAWKAPDQETLLAHTDRAIAAYELLKQAKPDSPQADYELGRLHLIRALNSYTIDNIIGRGTFKSYSHPAVRDTVQAHLNKAEEYFKAVIKARPDVAEAHYFLGRIHNFRSEPQKAAQALQEALKLQPNDPDVHVELAKNRLQQGQWQEALPAYQKAIELLSEQLAKKPDDANLKEQLVDLQKRVFGILKEKADSGLEGYKQAKGVAGQMSDRLFDMRMQLNREITNLRSSGKMAESDPLPEDLRKTANQLWAYAQTRPDLLAELTRKGLRLDRPPQTLEEGWALSMALSDAASLKKGVLNSTLGISKATPPADVKASLNRTIALIEKVRPDIAAYIRDKLANKDLVLGGPSDSGRIGAWYTIGQDMVLYDRFFELNDDEKASVLIHEITHAKCDLNLKKHLSKLGQTLEKGVRGLFGDHGPTLQENKMEYPAFLQQVAAFQELGITEKDPIYDIVKEGFVDETGHKWPPAQNNVELFQKIDKEGMWSTAEAFAANRSLARASTMKERAEMIKFLLDQSPTSGDQEQLVYDILSDASREPGFKELLQNLSLKQLEDELPSKFLDQVRRWYRSVNQ